MHAFQVGPLSVGNMSDMPAPFGPTTVAGLFEPDLDDKRMSLRLE